MKWIKAHYVYCTKAKAVMDVLSALIGFFLNNSRQLMIDLKREDGELSYKTSVTHIFHSINEFCRRTDLCVIVI